MPGRPTGAAGVARDSVRVRTFGGFAFRRSGRLAFSRSGGGVKCAGVACLPSLSPCRRRLPAEPEPLP